ncbi:hypothetical protein [Bacillus wiedmannii]|uniref:hypothetical protein n=1 Tax=Bacillus wiedmannii TaxID=1890302 RepID=UPI00211D476A|nr:hypothetical protein [Bacillus wiedmannii]
MANDIFKHARKRGHSIADNVLLDDHNLTGMAKYLLIQFCSHREGTWKITMTDIIQRSKNGRDAHYTALTELIHNKYVARVKVIEKGKHKEQIYIYGQVKEDVAEMLEETVASLQIQGYQVRVEFGEPLPENPDVETPNQETQYNIKEQEENTKEKILNIKKEDEDIPNVSPSDDLPHPNVKIEPSKEVKTTPLKLSDDDLLWITNMVRDIYKDKIQKRSFDSVLKKCINNYKKGTVPNYENYLITAVENKIIELELRKEREKSLLDLVPKIKNKKKGRSEMVPDWVKEQKQESESVGQPVSREPQQAYENEQQRIEDERKRLKDMLAKYKRE